jgi:hypothetical protein
LTSNPKSSNVEQLVLPQIRRMLSARPRDLRRVFNELARLRLDLKVKQLDIAGILKWADHDAESCEYKALQALLTNYIEALHLIDRLTLSLEALAHASSVAQTLEALQHVLADTIPFQMIYIYEWSDREEFGLVSSRSEVPSAVINHSHLFKQALRTKRYALGLARDAETGIPGRQLCVPILSAGEVRYMVVCSGISPHLHVLSGTAKVVLKLIEDFFATARSA